ncbi:hypothetical protein PHYSODRAFT_297514 [Phytophthora sojae]|uniref:Uncharacterized protein n=1 Tax=Phytophthora sojae (strain P6497) TaxID=1094619 RepID=G4YXB5_PHYSP|nr:hypothetical protein PHYSODRAFT_297514 [Phytophthora sojae]EGZ26149.1 hypothetical protein PHYSODRAFT_297514 [Phytophthora sojae]|eukprot:XP_009521437.1 hypothetical protein PHYSODRAFT_297514 [Phytophthora sojae]
MKFFAGVLVGHRGGVICVEVEDNARLGTLRRAFIDEVNRDDEKKRIQCPADCVELYLAQINGSWLQTQDERVKQLNAGEIPEDIQTILSGDPVDPTSSVNICAPEKTIQILLVARPPIDEAVQLGAGSKRKLVETEPEAPRKVVKASYSDEETAEADQDEPSNQGAATKEDEGGYKVGDLAAFAAKLLRLHVTGPEEHEDEIVGMLHQLLNEVRMERSDVERSGLASMVASLRRSRSAIIADTASALRKHMIRTLKH